MPSEEEMAWLSEKYPDTFDKYYRPRFEHWREQQQERQALVQQLPADAVPDLPDPDAVHRSRATPPDLLPRERVQGL
jgi:hypothetical protein